DEDGDELSASLEGSIQQGQIAREAGIYHARLVVSDGLNTAEKQVRVTVLAPEPTRVLKALPPLSVAEGGRLVVGLEADWAESFTVNPLPEGAFLSGNLLVWEPDGKAVSRDTQLNLTFTARDGEGHEASQQTTLLVKNVNTLPVLLSSSSQDGKSFGVGQELLFVVRAEDTDGDALSYAWAVNSKSVEASGNSVTLSFPSAGKKRISAVVSDGTKSVTRSWEITIARGPIVKLVPATQQKPASTTTQSVKALSQPLVLPEHETIRFVVVHKGDSAPLPSPAKNSNTLSFEVE
ncbi:MAG: hypothetical protein Q7S65_03665, partial [Nanoarchaeota archaeon]|nr:hypothetical protein [Nanoarchaeota archaeon]